MVLVNRQTPSRPVPVAGPLDEPLVQPRDDSRLAARFADGQDEAAREVVVRYGGLIARLVDRLGAWNDDPAELVQDVFVRALEARHSFRGDSTLETWLVRIAINVCRAAHRRRWLRRKLFATGADTAESPAGSEQSKNPHRGPVEAAVATEHAQLVRGAVARLSQKYREVVVLYYLEEMTAPQIAELLKLRQNTVEVRLSRARKELARSLGPLKR